MIKLYKNHRNVKYVLIIIKKLFWNVVTLFAKSAPRTGWKTKHKRIVLFVEKYLKPQIS